MKNNFFIKSITLSILFMLIFLFAFLFLLQKINKNNEHAEYILLEWNTETARRNGINALNDSIKDIEKEKILLDTHFVKSSDIVPFLDMIEGLGPKLKAKAEITSVDVLPESPGLMVGINATGSFDGLIRFLMLLENSPYEIEFNSMSIKELSDKTFKWIIDLKINLLSFI
jgi:hypothetical protein